MKLNQRLSKNIQLVEDLDRILIKGNFTVALRWNGNLKTRNKETELSTF